MNNQLFFLVDKASNTVHDANSSTKSFRTHHLRVCLRIATIFFFKVKLLRFVWNDSKKCETIVSIVFLFSFYVFRSTSRRNRSNLSVFVADRTGHDYADQAGDSVEHRWPSIGRINLAEAAYPPPHEKDSSADDRPREIKRIGLNGETTWYRNTR